MAVIKRKTNSTAAALTGAALALPGITAFAAVPTSSVKTNAGYGHYQESDGRMQVDVYHADALIPLSERLELAFSLDRDTYSGATPGFSLPVSMTNQLKYKQNDDGSYASDATPHDVVSAASGVSAASLTYMGGLEAFKSFKDQTSAAEQSIRNAENLGIQNLIQIKTDLLAAIDQQIALDSQPLIEQKNASLNDQAQTYQNAKIALQTDYDQELNQINSELPALTNNYQASIAALNAAKAAEEAGYLADNPRPNDPDSIASPVVINFNPGMNFSAYGGSANLAPGAGGNCPAPGTCYYEDGMTIGIVGDSSNPIAHLHRAGSVGNRELSYHADSSGIYIRSLDSKAFSLNSMKFNAAIGDENPDSGPNEFWEILGFNTAVNPDLDLGDGTNYSSRVAYQTIANGFNGILAMNDQFKNVNAVWIHYHGYPQTPADGKAFSMTLDDINISPVTLPTSQQQSWDSGLLAYRDFLTAKYTPQLQQLTDTYNSEVATLTSENAAAIATLNAQYAANLQATDAADAAARQAIQDAFDNALAALTSGFDSQKQAANQAYLEQKAALEGQSLTQIKQATIAGYAALLNQRIPNGTPTVQRFQLQPMETRSMPQFTTRYYFDNTTLSASGGYSDEPDFLSNFGSINFSHELNNKLTTFNAGYGVTSNTITRNSGGNHLASHHADKPEYGPAKYRSLNEQSTFHSFNLGFSQVLSKHTLFQSTANFTHQSGYLSNPYKYVYVRGEITPEEYYELSTNSSEVDWHKITKLEVAGPEVFRENRPRQRNLWSLSNHLNHHLPALDATLQFDYRFYIDDWNINSHTFDVKWLQALGNGWTVTPGIRYYSQSQAAFFAPYFLSPRADGHYSSDFRLSGFGDLSGGVTVGKQFARGIQLQTSFEYVTHSGNLKLGGGGIGSYADFDYYLAHANLSIDLASSTLAGIGGDHSRHRHHLHHGPALPAGVMFGHMLPQADDIMIGYRFQYGVQSGAMLHGDSPASNAELIANACPGFANGCLYSPTKMHMQMHMLDLMYAPTDWLNIMLMPQLMSMDMSMSGAIRPFANQTEQNNYGHHAGATHTSNELGDTTATALIKMYDQNGHHLHAGIGISAPTGSIAAEISQGELKSSAGTSRKPGSKVLQDYGMQLGSGSWDFKPSLTYSGYADDWGWGMQLSGVMRLETNNYGYALGDVFQASGWGSYHLTQWLSASLRGVYSAQGKIRGETDQPHQTTSPVDYPGNYGGRYVDVGFGLNAAIPQGQFAGHQFGVEWLQPVHTDHNGYQLDRDGALTATWNFAF